MNQKMINRFPSRKAIIEYQRGALDAIGMAQCIMGYWERGLLVADEAIYFLENMKQLKKVRL